MAKTYESIATTTLTSNQTTVTFSSIPQTYTDLILICNTFTSGTPALTGPTFRIGNGSVDTGNNYSWTFISGNGSSVSSNRSSNNSVAPGPSQDSTTTEPSLAIAHFMNYSNTTTNKTIIMRGGTTSKQTNAYVSLWRSTDAINIITLRSPDNESASTPFASGSTFSLYGIKSF